VPCRDAAGAKLWSGLFAESGTKGNAYEILSHQDKGTGEQQRQMEYWREGELKYSIGSVRKILCYEKVNQYEIGERRLAGCSGQPQALIQNL
jgi:hypothetical protein